MPPPTPGDDTLVRLSCLDDDAQGEQLEVLWERELDAELLRGASMMHIADRGFDKPDIFSAYLHTLRWNCVTATNPRLLQAPYRAGIEVLAYQLEPLRKALLLPRVNLFVADDVGLGKTIEAGLILRELLMRQKVRRVVVAVPPSVVVQWRDELEQRFGLTFVIFDREYVLQKRRERGFGINPWTTHSRFIISHALLRDEAYAGSLREWIKNDDHLTPEAREPALLILDEAHNAAPASSGKYATDSRFTRTIREIAPLFEHRLFLSATPHNGHSNSFSALLEILDPQRFCRGVKASKKNVEAVMVRRLKEDLREIKMPGFPKREVIQIDIDGLPADAPELELAALLDQYRELREAKLAEASKTTRAAAGLVIISLQKRLLSSIRAFASTLRVHRRALELGREKREIKTQRGFEYAAVEAPGPDDDRADLPEAEVREQEDSEVEAATRATSSSTELDAAQRKILDRMTQIAESAAGDADARVVELVAWIKSHCLGRDGRWNDRRVLIFTEYADTKAYLFEQLRTALSSTDYLDERIRAFHGGMGDEAREEVKRAFNSEPADDRLRILIATDAAREGVNLQNHCADLFHFDVPWNPSRMEQRNGRIDRKLQRAEVVRCHYFVLTQRPEDRVLEILVKKTRTIQAELGSLSQVLEARLGRRMEGGIRRRDLPKLQKALLDETIEEDKKLAAEEELDGATRVRRDQLIKQIEDLRGLMETAREAIAFDEDAFRDALSSGLRLLGTQALERVGGEEDVWSVPVEDKLLRDPTWAQTLDTLRAPRARGEKLWDWRKTSPIRPVVFRDQGSLADKRVHLHLEHRLVQRILGRFLAQGFVRDDIARAACVLTDNAIPRVVLLGRLSLYGEHGSRLHDEIIAVAARWTEPAARREPLKPYADDAKAKTLDLVEKALVRAKEVPKTTREHLTGNAERDFRDLEGALASLAAERGARAEEELRRRGAKEAQEMREILEGQKKRIQEQLDRTTKEELVQKETRQLALGLPGFSDDERRQLDSDKKHWGKRLRELDEEIPSEPARIEETYRIRARRVEPVGLVYLWPVTG